jgi:hypothetical protein
MDISGTFKMERILAGALEVVEADRLPGVHPHWLLLNGGCWGLLLLGLPNVRKKVYRSTTENEYGILQKSTASRIWERKEHLSLRCRSFLAWRRSR